MPNKQEMSAAWDRFLGAKKRRDAAWKARQLARANLEEIEQAVMAAEKDLKGAQLKLANIGLSLGIQPRGGPAAA